MNNATGDIYYVVDLLLRRNDERMNQFIKPAIDHFQSNEDFTVLADPVRMAEYTAKYSSKAERISEASKEVIDAVAEKAAEAPAEDSTLKFLVSIFLQLNGLRDYSACEVNERLFSLC